MFFLHISGREEKGDAKASPFITSKTFRIVYYQTTDGWVNSPIKDSADSNVFFISRNSLGTSILKNSISSQSSGRRLL